MTGSCKLSTNRGDSERFFKGSQMMSFVFYSMSIMGLIWWVESPQFLATNSLIMRKNPGELLELWLKNFHWGKRSELKEVTELPRYKFYTEIIEVLLNLARRMGGNYQAPLLFLREGLQSDRQFEKKLKEIKLGAWLQMGMMVALTWAFILGALMLVEVKIAFLKLCLILFWQSLGLLALPMVLKILRKKYFADIGRLWKMLYVLRSLTGVPLSRSEILGLASVQELKGMRQKNLGHIVEKLKDTCQRMLKEGGHYEDEIKHLMEELRFQEKWHFELFEKRLTVVKLGLMTIFFLPSYLAFIFCLLGDLLTLM